jgi:Membrane-associated phospholipid phosphatase
MHSPVLDRIMPMLTFLGSGGAVWIFIALLLVMSKKHRGTGIMMMGALVLCLIVGNLTLKPFIARARPCWVNTNIHLLVPSPKDYSFPSGHTMSSFAAAGVLILRNRRWGLWAMLLAVLIAFSRLYLYVHYPSDVAAGLVLGIATAILTIKASPFIKNAFGKLMMQKTRQ